MSEKHIHEAIVIEILARVPIKNLTRFKCVSKAWKDLIEEASFMEKYRNTPRPGKLMAISDKGLCFVGVEDTATTGTEPPQSLGCPFGTMIDESTLCVLHCHGMLCVTLKNQGLAVWHPYSTDFKIIPNRDGILRDSNILGFGYDRSSDDYKIVTFVDRLNFSTAYVFEFKSNSWRETAKIPRPDWHYRDRRGAFVDQNLYWIAHRSDQDRFILSFNLKTHEYRKLPFPVNVNRETSSSWSSGMGQNLCVTEIGKLNQEITVSVKDKTGSEPGSWNKVMAISTSSLISSAPYNYGYLVDFVSLTNNNDVIIMFTGHFAGFYDGSNEQMKKKVFLYRDRNKRFEEVQFRDSIVGLRFLQRYVEGPVIKRIFI